MFDMMKKTGEINPKTGLPLMDEAEKKKSGRFFVLYVYISAIIWIGVGVGVGFVIHNWGSTDIYDARINTISEYDLQWACLGSILLDLAVIQLNVFPYYYKAKIMRLGNTRANMLIFKLATDKNPEESSAVILHEEGDLGFYNRANRSLYHFLEWSVLVIATLPLTMYVYPFPSFIILVFFCLGRIIYQVGYTRGGFGDHVPGFAI